MKIVVMCETLQQFHEYTCSMLRDRNKLPIKVVADGCHSIVNIENIQFIYCNNLYTLKGRSFGKDDYIVKVGSWYNIAIEIQEAIVTEFMARHSK